MKFATSSEHRDFFYKNGLIELEGLVSPAQLVEINKSIDESLEKRLAKPLRKATSEEVFSAGRDLWRISDVLKRLSTNSRMAQLATELTGTRNLRLGYEQFFPETKRLFDSQALPGTYYSYVRQQKTLNEISCLQDIACGLLLCLSGTPTETADKQTIFSSTPGNGVYFNPQLAIDFNAIELSGNQRYLLIVYAEASSVYLLNESDPHTHALKHLGYVFGDKLHERLNPTVFR